MNKLPRISGSDCARALERLGFREVRRESSHMVMRKMNPWAQVCVPDHKELDRGTLRPIIRTAGLSVEEFVRAL